MKKEEHNARLRDHYIAIGIRISYFRKLRGLSQEQLAERAGISPGFLSQVEAPGMAVGISLSTLFLIAEPPAKRLYAAGRRGSSTPVGAAVTRPHAQAGDELFRRSRRPARIPHLAPREVPSRGGPFFPFG